MTDSRQDAMDALSSKARAAAAKAAEAAEDHRRGQQLLARHYMDGALIVTPRELREGVTCTHHDYLHRTDIENGYSQEVAVTHERVRMHTLADVFPGRDVVFYYGQCERCDKRYVALIVP